MTKGERFNSISHLVGACLALVGASVLITVGTLTGSAIQIVSYTVYGITLFLLFLFSTLYHSMPGRVGISKVKRVFQILDYQAIYLLIAGTYTPFALLTVQGTTGWWLFGIIWGLAAIGILLETLPIPGPRIIPIVIYLGMGWSCLFVLDPIISALPTAGFYWLLAGGIVYTAGVIFYVLDHWFPWCHEIWHLFVIGGSTCHYFAVFLL